MKMWDELNAATSFIFGDNSIALPYTSPAMLPTPAAVNSSVMQSRPISSKWRLTLSHDPRAVIAMPLWLKPAEPPEANASPSQNPYSADKALAMSEKSAVPLSAATTKYGSSPS